MRYWFKKVIIVILVAPMVMLLLWYAIYFLPHLGAIKNIQEQGMSEIAPIEKIIYPIAVIADGNDGMRSYSLRTAYSSEVLKGERIKISQWHLNTMLWQLVSYIHFNKKEIFYLWAMYAPYEKGRGLQNSSKHYYGKPLKELSIDEKITILAIPKAPSLYKIGSEKLKERVRKIFHELNT